VRGGILLAVAFGGLALLAWQLVPWPNASPVVERVDVVGVERLAPDTVRSESGIAVGSTWSSGVQRRAIDALTQLPQVRTAQIHAASRASHDGIVVRIDVAERQPYGVVELDGGRRHWVDRDGVLLEQVERQPPSLPVLSGVETTPSPQGPQVNSEHGVRVLRSFYALSGDKLRQFASLRFRGYDLVLQARTGWRALLPARDLSAQLDRLRRVVRALRAEGDPGWRTLDLRVPGEVVIGR